MSNKVNSPTLAPHRTVKLVATASLLIVIEGTAIILLLLAGESVEPLALFDLALKKTWCLGFLAGVLGGTSRALHAFLVEIRAFEIFRRTGQPPASLRRLTGGGLVEHTFDFMFVWYLYLIKPFLGGAVGFLFALLHQFGLVPFLSGDGRDAYGIVLVGGMAGIFAETALARFRTMFRERSTAVSEGDQNAIKS